jgi:hypothetical protein
MGRTIKWTEKKIAEMVAEGYGLGTKESYKPWLNSDIVKSSGVTHDPYCEKIRRTVSLLSTVEESLYYALNWQTDIVDIREQYPLDRDLCRSMADRLGIAQVCYPDTRVPTVLTVDILVTRLRDGKEEVEAYNAKVTSEAEDPRSMEKLEIQRAVLAESGIPHHLVFDTDIPKQPIKNLRWIHSSQRNKIELEPYDGFLEEMRDALEPFLAQEIHSNTTLGELCKLFDSNRGVPRGTGIRAARMLMGKHVLIPDLQRPEPLTHAMTSFRMTTAHQGRRAFWGRK